MVGMKLSYQQLVDRLGEPTVTRKVMGTLGYRFDEFPCGCTRVVRMGDNPLPIDDEGHVVLRCEVQFHACRTHASEFADVEVS